MSQPSIILAIMHGGDLAFVISAYFDESEDDGGNLLCVAGYFFVKSKLREFEKRWQAMLDRFDLPFFRMSACNAGRAPFDKLTKEQRVEVQTIAIQLVKRYNAYGVAVTVDPREFADVVRENRFVWNAYQFLVWMCLIAGRAWMDKYRPNGGRIRFYFEAGHKHQSSAVAMMCKVIRNPTLKAAYRAAEFGFVGKTELPCQAADLLAWQWAKDSRRRREGAEQPRADCRALVNTGHHVLHASGEPLKTLMREVGLASV